MNKLIKPQILEKCKVPYDSEIGIKFLEHSGVTKYEIELMKDMRLGTHIIQFIVSYVENSKMNVLDYFNIIVWDKLRYKRISENIIKEWYDRVMHHIIISPTYEKFTDDWRNSFSYMLFCSYDVRLLQKLIEIS
jgi:hypothetical protein